MPTVTVAERMPDGSLRLVIEIAPATAVDDAIIETFTFGKDVPVAAAKREARLVIRERYKRSAREAAAEGDAIDCGPDVDALIAERAAKAAGVVG